jgi:hypothetical protein
MEPDMTDASETRCFLNPVACHSWAIVGSEDVIRAARDLVEFQIDCGPESELAHWLGIYAVLNGERGRV